MPAEPTAPRGRRRWWWAVGTVCGVLLLAAAYYLIRRASIESLSDACREALRANDYERLERLAARWHWWQPAKAAPLIYLAEAASQTGRHERAVELLDQLPDADPMTPPALVERSTMLFGPLNRPLEAAETLERAVKLDPKLVEARRRLVYFYAFTLQRRKMVHHAYEAIRRQCDSPETYVYLIAQDWLSFANAFAENTKWLRGDPDEELFLVARALHQISSRTLDETTETREIGATKKDGIPRHRKIAAELLERFPENVELIAYRLNRAIADGDAEEVARLLNRAPPEAASDNRFWRYKAWLLSTRGELAEAETCYRKALSLNCYDYVSRHQLAGVARRLRRFDEVKPLGELARDGKELRREIILMKSVAEVPPETLRRMARYAKDCGDDLAATQLTMQIERWLERSPGPASAADAPRVLFGGR